MVGIWFVVALVPLLPARDDRRAGQKTFGLQIFQPPGYLKTTQQPSFDAISLV